MQRSPPIIFAFVLAARLVQAAGEELFTWRAPLAGAWTNDALYVAPVPLAVWDGSELFPADLRIFDENGREWPFYLTDRKARMAEVIWDVEPAGQRLETLPVRHLRHTVHLQGRGASAEARHHQAVILMAGLDFDRRVEVLGRREGGEWEWLGQAHLINRPGATRAGNRNVFYEPTTFTQLQFRIYPSAPVPDEPLVLLGLTVLSESNPDTESWLDVTWTPRPEAAGPGVQSLVADLGYRNLPLRHVRLELGAGPGAFPVKLYGRSSSTNSWRWVADGTVAAYRDRRRTTLELQQTGYRYLRVDFLHVDQDPVTVLSSQAGYEPLHLVFEADYGHHPHLYFGAARSPLPRYDLQRRVGPGLPGSVLPAEVGERRRNPARMAAALRSYGRTLVWSASGVVAGLVVLIFVKRLRRPGV